MLRYEPNNVHHHDATSFQEALELPCDFCVRLHKAFSNSTNILASTKADSHKTDSLLGNATKDPYRTGPTRYRFSSRSAERLKFVFKSHSCYAYPVLEAYDCKRGIPSIHPSW